MRVSTRQEKTFLVERREPKSGQYEVIQDKTEQGQGNASQGNSGQDKIGQSQARLEKTRQITGTQDLTGKSKIRQDKTKQYKTK